MLAATAAAASLWLVAATAHAETRRLDRERVEVEDVVMAPDGQYVVILKTRDAPARFLPIWIGEAEATAIRMRLDRTKPPRPLTLNLLESVLASSNIVLLEIQIDALKGDVFLGKLRLRQDQRTWELDARPSDAIGLAVSRDAVIWVSRAVMEEAGVSATDVESHKRGAASGERQTPQPPVYDETL